jgi:hypothetical protein
MNTLCHVRTFRGFFLCEKTVTTMTYRDMLQFYLLAQLEDNRPDVVFQQHCAPPQRWAHIV